MAGNEGDVVLEGRMTLEIREDALVPGAVGLTGAGGEFSK